jgi:DNA polymerase III subunit beta
MILQTEELADIMNKMRNAVDKRSLIDFERYVYMSWSDGVIVVSAFKIGQYIRMKMSAVMDGTGEILVDPAKMYNLLSTLSEVTKVVIDQEVFKLTLKSGGSKLGVKGLNPHLYPEWETQYGVEIKLPWSHISALCTQAQVVIRKNKIMPIKSCIHLSIKDGGAEMVATDGYQLALRRFDVDYEDGLEGIMLPGHSMMAVRDVFTVEDTVFMSSNPHFTWFVTENAEVMMSTLEGKYPDYSKITELPRVTKCTVEKALLVKALKQAETYSDAEIEDYYPCIISLEQDGVFVTNDVGMNTRIEAEVVGDDYKIEMTPKMASEAIRSMKADNVDIWTSPPFIGVFMETEDSLFIVMGRE